MDWVVVTAAASAGAAALAVMGWKLHKERREIYRFTERLESALDEIIRGKDITLWEETEDTLESRVSEKLKRVRHIWEQKDKESREAKQQIKELISDISHQTKTPIANQKLYLEILRQQPQTEEAQGFLNKLEHQTDKLDFLFQSMVKMSRLEAGVIQIRKKEEDLIRTVQRAISSVVPHASKKGISLYAGMEECLMTAHDPKWTEEAVYNLLDNAVKYTPRGGKVEIFIKRGEIFTEIHVRDNGKGIAPERQASVFTRFYREPEVHDQEGVGIGLYLTRKIAELQNGYVEVRSAEGQGADFRLCLPNITES